MVVLWKYLNRSACLRAILFIDAKHPGWLLKRFERYDWFIYTCDTVLSVVWEFLSWGKPWARSQSFKLCRFASFRKDVKYWNKDPGQLRTFELPSYWLEDLINYANRHYYLSEELFPDISAYSLSTKQLIIVKLTGPWETNIPQYLYEMNKCLMFWYGNSGPPKRLYCISCLLFAVEVGALGVLPSKTGCPLIGNIGKSGNDTGILLCQSILPPAAARFWSQRDLYPQDFQHF